MPEIMLSTFRMRIYAHEMTTTEPAKAAEVPTISNGHGTEMGRAGQFKLNLKETGP